MALTIQQIPRMEQRMILSPQMQQAIYLLQVPLQELSVIIRNEMVQNPLLEDSNEQLQSVDADREVDSSGQEPGELEFQAEVDRLAEMSDEWKEYFFQDQNFSPRRYYSLDEEKRNFMENSITRSETLSEHLLNQLNTSLITGPEKSVAEIIIGYIDENGYLTETSDDISLQSGISLEEVEVALNLIQTFHPAGVGARDLRECLLNQLKTRKEPDPLAYEIVDRFMAELGSKKYPIIARALKTTPKMVQKAAEYIAALDPKPGRIFGPDDTFYVTPDIYLKKDDDDYRIVFNREYTPRLRISSHYRKLLTNPETLEKTKEYIREKLSGGLWLIKNIRLRQGTLYKITEEIVRRQKEFFDKGVAYLRPLRMTEVAPIVGVHESTVSRAVANKYIQTPRGTFPLRYFFTSSLTTSDGDDISSQSVKKIIEKIFAEEDRRHPLSDQEVVEMLAEQNIELARRTVAKYRKNLKIPASHLRKRY